MNKACEHKPDTGENHQSGLFDRLVFVEKLNYEWDIQWSLKSGLIISYKIATVFPLTIPIQTASMD